MTTVIYSEIADAQRDVVDVAPLAPDVFVGGDFVRAADGRWYFTGRVQGLAMSPEECAALDRVHAHDPP